MKRADMAAMLGALALAPLIGGVPARAAADEVGKPAKPYKIQLLDRSVVTADQLKGKVVVINRWATWCTPCKAEMVVFQTYMHNHPDSDLQIFAVTTELGFPADKLKPLQGKLAYPLGLQVFGGGYGIKAGVPTSYVIDRSGIVRFAAAGAFNDDSFEATVGPLLKEPAPAAAP
ncbi:TlpA disulfide reductase family protein [Phenylobacterium sp.]|uniref:TlpA family protein disulfide reductase n=1 Tax=Phenylobacterium sp. TaxID=1871053 RepID=UPI0012118D71|nr:TlpA disulfide reductase family protein [Phenylobacterium sp.]THD64989.1 MAG: TlpA family protein disulfide reductase [Phenylobacterium sp.]